MFFLTLVYLSKQMDPLDPNHQHHVVSALINTTIMLDLILDTYKYIQTELHVGVS